MTGIVEFVTPYKIHDVEVKYTLTIKDMDIIYYCATRAALVKAIEENKLSMVRIKYKD